MAITIGMLGATGRMGHAILKVMADDPHVRLTGAVAKPGNPAVGTDAYQLVGEEPCGVAISDNIETLIASKPDVVIDFTLPNIFVDNVRLAAEHGVPLVSGTTGISDAEWAVVHQAAKEVPVFWGSNLSLGVSLLAMLVEETASRLDDSFDIEVMEMHHRHKVDAPSGTALTLGEAAARGRGVVLDNAMVTDRHGNTGAREPGDIGFAVLRGGDVVGEHTVIFAGDGERIELTHKASDRAIFARGAVRAAKWLVRQPAGFYRMRDMLA